MAEIPDSRYKNLKNPSLVKLNESQALLWDGRHGNQEFLSLAWVYDLLSNTWKRFEQNNIPSGRMHHCMVNAASKLFVYGGISRDEKGNFSNESIPYILDYRR